MRNAASNDDVNTVLVAAVKKNESANSYAAR